MDKNEMEINPIDNQVRSLTRAATLHSKNNRVSAPLTGFMDVPRFGKINPNDKTPTKKLAN